MTTFWIGFVSALCGAIIGGTMMLLLAALIAGGRSDGMD